MVHLNESKLNTTQASSDFVSWLRTDRGLVAQVEVFLVLSVLLHSIHVVCGWWRRCSSNSYIKYSLWLAYTANPSVVVYLLGLMRAASPKGSLFGLITISLLMALGSTNSMTAYTIDDNKQYLRHFIQQGLYVLSFFSIVQINFSKFTSFRAVYGLFGIIGFIFMVSINMGRIHASMTASSFWDKQTSILQDHMATESTEGYDYLVDKEIDSQTQITVSQIWGSREGPLRASEGEHLKEVCLSFALFRLLRRRFFGIPCPESKHPKTRDLVLKKLLSDVAENNNSDTAYRVVAAELAFAYDHFFTSSGSFNTGMGKGILMMSLFKIVVYGGLVVGLIPNVLPKKLNEANNSRRWAVPATLFDIILTTIIMLVLLALELLQLYLYLSSDWAKVQIVRYSISGKDIPFYYFRMKLPQIFGYCQNKIGQHSLLKDLHGRSFISDTIGSLSGCFFGECIEYDSTISRGLSHPGIKGPDHIELTRDLKLTIAQTLIARHDQLSNGTVALRQNGQHELQQFCDPRDHVSTILIWHIATEYCDIIHYHEKVQQRNAQSHAKKEQKMSNAHHKIASMLSRYCAYLMAYVPELLPGHELGTRKLFDNVRHVALNRLSDARQLDKKYKMLKRFSEKSSDGDDKIFIEGIRLGKQLEKIGDVKHWKILADFWCELILYVAPSDNAKAHFEHLSNGGEFLTHLWALLFHAGITERGELNLDVENGNTSTTSSGPQQARPNLPDARPNRF